MKTTKTIVTSLICITIAGAALQQAAGAVIITITEQGPNVVLAGTGSLNTTSLIQVGIGGSASAEIYPDIGHFIVGSGSALLYDLVSGPAAIGPGSTYYSADLSSGSAMGISIGSLVVPSGYVSGSALASNATFIGHSLASLGIAEGAYVWTWGSGATADSLTLNVIPETSTTMLACLGMGGLILKRNRNGRTRRHS